MVLYNKQSQVVSDAPLSFCGDVGLFQKQCQQGMRLWVLVSYLVDWNNLSPFLECVLLVG